MIGLDTNVVVRYLVGDDPRQSAAATELVTSLTVDEPGFLSVVTVVETFWVLRRSYRVTAQRCAEVIEGLLDSRELRVQHQEVVRNAVSASHNGFDFADAVINELGRRAGCDYTVTFDRGAAGSDQMRLLLTAD